MAWTVRTSVRPEWESYKRWRLGEQWSPITAATSPLALLPSSSARHYIYPWDEETPRYKKHSASLLPVSNTTPAIRTLPNAAMVSAATLFVFALGSTIIYQHTPVLHALVI
ncbi:hypothetical protein RhiLY_14147 [Ceratobasidium sp. AG-Ba]|nr:hypothetical protein RhiLY_14147 [Ceratobasidium sp. AG-Ba]